MLRGTPGFDFFTTGFSYFLDFLMQGLWNETQTSPLEARYWSCVPYPLGHGQAMMYSDGQGEDAQPHRQSAVRDAVRQLPGEAMIKTLSETDVELISW